MTLIQSRTLLIGIIVAVCIIFPPIILMATTLAAMVCGLGLVLSFVGIVIMGIEGLWSGKLDLDIKETAQGVGICALGLIISISIILAVSPLIEMWVDLIGKFAE